MRKPSALIRLVFGTCLAMALTTSVSASVAEAKIIVVSETQKTYRPPTNETASSLREFSLIEMKKLIRLPGEPVERQTHATDVRMILKTTSVPAIEDYLVVQFIRGCLFESQWDGRTEHKHLRFSREHLGEVKTFKHPEWDIDSESLDPAYSSYRDLGRFALWRWNQNPASFDPERATWYAHGKPPHPVVYLTDLPGGASRYDDFGQLQEARNTSLEFRTCLFHARDLPGSLDPKAPRVDISKAIACHTWDHKYVYDFKQQRFTSPKQIDSVCLN